MSNLRQNPCISRPSNIVQQQNPPRWCSAREKWWAVYSSWKQEYQIRDFGFQKLKDWKCSEQIFMITSHYPSRTLIYLKFPPPGCVDVTGQNPWVHHLSSILSELLPLHTIRIQLQQVGNKILIMRLQHQPEKRLVKEKRH